MRNVTDGYACVCSKMKLYSLTVLYKGFDGRVKKLCGASDLASFGYFQRSRLAVLIIRFSTFLFMCVFLLKDMYDE